MGWNTFKKKFNIQHPIHVLHDANMLCIGTREKTRLAYVCMETGRLEGDAHYSFLKESYPSILTAKPAQRLDALKKKDNFGKSTHVYSFDYILGSLVTHSCEHIGYYKTTNRGDLMFKGVHFARKYDALEKAKLELESRVKWLSDEITEKEVSLTNTKRRFQNYQETLARLNTELPLTI